MIVQPAIKFIKSDRYSQLFDIFTIIKMHGLTGPLVQRGRFSMGGFETFFSL